MTLIRLKQPYRGYRFRVTVYGGHQDGAVIDCRTLQWAMVWYRLLTEMPQAPQEGASADAERKT